MIIKNSIKSRLFVSISLFITITLLIIAIISFSITKHESKEIFDSNLVRTAKLLLSLTKHEVIEHETNDNFIIDLGLAEEREFHRYEYKTHFQIWKEDYLIYNSSSDVVIDKPLQEGFRNNLVKKIKWRSFAIHDQESGVTIEVMERKDVRGELIKKILTTLLLPLIISFIPILIIIWLVVNKSLIKLTKLSRDIKNVSPLLLKPIEKDENLPAEVRPLIKSLNFLLAKLDESMNKERKFINYASHELRTPLAVIKTKTQFLIKKHKDNPQLISDLENLLNAADRIINLSNQLLTLSRIGIEKKMIETERLNLSALVKEVIINHNLPAHGKNIEIIAEISTDYYINANQFHIEILLNNILDNAIKYSPSKETILVKVYQDDDCITLSIFNKGQMLSKEQQEHIFDRFYRANYSTSDGSGLGLSIVKRISDLYGFEIELISNEEGNCIICKIRTPSPLNN